MSTIRFVHTDHFRLGTALSGLSDSPAWLQQLATNCVRQSVRNVIEAAVAKQAQFLFIAGSITESREDLEPVIRWLDEQFETLRLRGIRVVAAAGDAETTAALERICDVVLRRGQSLIASRADEGNIHLATTTTGSSASGDLLVTIGDHGATLNGRLTYRAVPSIRPDHGGHHPAHSGAMTCSAGAVQAVSASETWEGGCLLVDADLSSMELQANVIDCDVIRFSTERVSLANVAATRSLVPEVIEASNALNGRTTQTVIVDWVLNAKTATDASQVAALSGDRLLADLRDRLHGGHHGVWPRAVSFSGESSLQLEADDGMAMEEFFDVVNGPVSSVEGIGVNGHRVYLQGGIGVSSELVTGLRLLHKAA